MAGKTRELRVMLSADDPLGAAAEFYAQVLPIVVADQTNDLLLIFPPADHTHRAWRLAAVQEIARSKAPLRVNAAASNDPAAIMAALAYLDGAAGVTGQYLPLADVAADSQRAG
ncbi:MAG: Rossmann fold domain-containing protein [Novosphingobium sp.]